jgi:DNA-binding IclR family transcriptional regulator
MFSMQNVAFRDVNSPARLPAPAIARAARILDVVAAAESPVGVSQIARQAVLSKSSAHALVTALVAEGLLTPSLKGYRLGGRLAHLGARARDQRMQTVAERVLAGMSAQLAETALFGRVEGTRVHILARTESERSLSLSAPVGSTVPLMAGALGKAYLTTLSKSEARSFLSSHQPHRYTERSVTDVASYLREVQTASERGFASERGEYLPGIAAVASAIPWSASTYLLWAVGIDATIDDSRMELLGSALRDAAAEIRRQLENEGEPAERNAS